MINLVLEGSVGSVSTLPGLLDHEENQDKVTVAFPTISYEDGKNKQKSGK